jgi:hypothetical protein
MTEDPQPGAAPVPGAVETGVPEVDQVIAAVEELEERPIEEHVGVFQAAHDQLRRALDPAEPGASAGDQPA